MQSTVSSRGQTAIPSKIRRKYQIKPKARLEWIDNNGQLIVIPLPENPVESLRGLSRDLNLRRSLLEDRRKEKAHERKK